MSVSTVIALAAMVIAAITFFYKIGQDTKEQSRNDGKLDTLMKSVDALNEKLDNIAEWQREAAAIHSGQEQQIRTIFHRLDSLDARMDDRGVMIEALRKILEKVT